MRTLRFASAVVTALLVSAAAAGAQSTPDAGVRPPDGAYRYVIRESGTKVGESSIDIRTAGGTVTVAGMAAGGLR